MGPVRIQSSASSEDPRVSRKSIPAHSQSAGVGNSIGESLGNCLLPTGVQPIAVLMSSGNFVNREFHNRVFASCNAVCSVFPDGFLVVVTEYRGIDRKRVAEP